jgi:hypothetical protein
MEKLLLITYKRVVINGLADEGSFSHFSSLIHSQWRQRMVHYELCIVIGLSLHPPLSGRDGERLS